MSARLVTVLALAAGAAGLALAADDTGGPGAGARRVANAASTKHFTVEVNGDLLIHSPVYARALANGHGRHYDFRPMLRSVRPLIAGADYAICHVETPMSPRRPSGYPVFNTPPALAQAIAATGWDACDTASNHSLDQGQYGVDQTGRALDRAGVAHTGSFRSAAARRHVLMFAVHGVKVAFLAYTEMTNGEPLPHPWSVNLARAGRILRDARRARMLGAGAVIVTLHWGTENVASPSSFQRDLAHRLAASRDITAVVGQHVHRVQPIANINHKLIVYGEGNLLSNQTTACCPAAAQDGMIVLLDFVADSRGIRVADIRYVPIWTRHPDYRVLPVGDALGRHQARAAVLRASYRRTTAVAGRSRRVHPVPTRLPR